jgi:hypothetical protein
MEFCAEQDKGVRVPVLLQGIAARAVREILPNLDKLQPIDRASRYREYAEEMFCRSCYAACDETRLGYLKMSAEWLRMADKLEAEYCKISVCFDAPELASMLRQVRPASS